jgi:hypothetical protein
MIAGPEVGNSSLRRTLVPKTIIINGRTIKAKNAIRRSWFIGGSSNE